MSGMRSRLLDLAFAGVAIAAALLLTLPAIATVLTPDWIETATFTDWSAVALFFTGAAALLFLAWRLSVPRLRPPDALFYASDWWFLTALAAIATLFVGLASTWVIAIPGAFVVGMGVLMARRRAARERQQSVPTPPPGDVPRIVH